MTKTHINDPSLILYELNEVPKELIIRYAEIKPKSTFGKLLKNGKLIKTINKDKGELHPWTTWPTLHRGINNNKHKIQFINQNLKDSKIYPPIWEILQRNGIKVGIFGSLQSYPPLISENTCFYLPDTFAPKADAYPHYLEVFQKFNLNVCSENKAISNLISKKLYFQFINLLLSGICSIPTALKIMSHVSKEKINPQYRLRRPLLQPILGFDLFIKSLNKYNPSFSTFFTNHVAGIIHRYWRDLFPEDFSSNNFYKVDPFKRDSIIKAMDIADTHLKRLIKYCDKNKTDLWIASSMGQKARNDIHNSNDIQISNFRLLIESLELNTKNYIEQPAMQPDVCVKCKSIKDARNLIDKIKDLHDKKEQPIIIERYKSKNNIVNLSLQCTEEIIISQEIKLKNKVRKLTDIGINIISRDPGTAYHSPEGILLIYGENHLKLNHPNNKFLDTTKIVPMILRMYGIKTLNYMKEIK